MCILSYFISLSLLGWFHFACGATTRYEASRIDNYYCTLCRSQDPSLHIIYKDDGDVVLHDEQGLDLANGSLGSSPSLEGMSISGAGNDACDLKLILRRYFEIDGTERFMVRILDYYHPSTHISFVNLFLLYIFIPSRSHLSRCINIFVRVIV